MASTQSQDPVTVLFIGAGNINFGAPCGSPWNHSLRVERKLGPRLKVLGLVDPVRSKAEAVLASKSTGAHAGSYADAVIYPSIAAATSALGTAGVSPDLILLGCPPQYRGTTDASKGYDAEVQLTTAFPHAGLFVEKPITTSPVEDAQEVAAILESRKSNIVSVGYMLRYSAAAQKMKQIIDENKLTVMMTSARYINAYEFGARVDWWDKSKECGPIIEQGTHFCDLSRYFGGEVDLDSVFAHSLEWYEDAGKLSKLAFDENTIPEENRIPRFTSATWKYANGAVGHLEHGSCLHDLDYNTEFTVFADGYLLKLIDPYNHPELQVRAPGSDTSVIYHFEDDDAFFNELSTFIDQTMTGKSELPVLSSFYDASKSYEFTWAIRLASERTRKAHPSVQNGVGKGSN